MSDPNRFRDGGADVPAELARLFETGAKDLPSEGDLRRLAARLGPVLEPPGGGSAWPGWPVIGKVAALAVVVAGSAVFFALNFGPHTPRPPDRPDAPAPTEAFAPSDSALSALNAATASAADAGAVPPAASGAVPPAASAPSDAGSSRSEATAPRAAETEAELLERARDALSANPARALALTEQDRTRFPAGVLAQERDVIAIQALARLGRKDEAARRAADFARLYPNSAYRKKLDQSAP
ncbi:MAG TPA: hypothetical protein VMI54_08085 [Polyangiaceae bacterium]|nr:hypothetical protein [Polyangiaceae bacterium]